MLCHNILTLAAFPKKPENIRENLRLLMKEKSPHCPHCAKMIMKLSRPRGRRDAIMAWFGFSPIRCHNCRYRTYIRASRAKEMADSMETVAN